VRGECRRDQPHPRDTGSSLPSPMPDALSLAGVTKRFGLTPAVSDLHLTVRAGELYALLGSNGAGKTTTLRMAAGLLRPDHGLITVLGVDLLSDPLAAKRLTAWLPDEPMIYDKLTPVEYLAFVAGLWQMEAVQAEARASELLDWLELKPYMHERCENFSRGMRQKVALAGALLHDPQLLLLDEPLTGIDASIAREVKHVLQERVDRGATVVLTTHILEVAERLADRIGILHAGRLLAEGSLDELRHQIGRSSSSLEDVFLHLVEFSQMSRHS
jgi:ABC-2 type transport system ATP-binding protein